VSASHRINCVCAQCGKAYRKRADRVCTPDYCNTECRRIAISKTTLSRQKQCEVCNTPFIPRLAQVRVNQGRFCSQKCNQVASVRNLNSPETRAKARATWNQNGNAEKLRQKVGDKNPQWKGGRFKSSGYFWLRDPGVRSAKSEHRRIVEAHLGRVLGRDEVVHHINHDKTDNRIENLAVMTRAEHMREHQADISAAKAKVSTPRPQKLSANDVIEIRSLAADGKPHVEIARRYGVTGTNIGLIVKRRIWAHV
jgi:hypothetical protein